MSTASDGDGGFLTFYRQYAHTGIHTVTATALTAFGLLTFVHRGFVALAIAVYVLPPIYLYLTRDGEAPEPLGDDTGASDTTPGQSPTAEHGYTDDEVPPGDRTERRPERDDEPTAGGTVADTGSNDRRSAGREGSATAAGSATAESGAEAGSPDDGGSQAEPETTPGSSGGNGVEDADGDREVETVPAEWVEADSPTEETLLGAVAAGDGAYAVGTGGVLLARARDGAWEVALEGGPAAESATLRGVDATSEGGAVWVAGDGGVLGRYDPAAGRHTDHSAPRGITDNWADLAVAGAAGAERVALVNGSGQVLLGEYDGAEVEWDEPVKPGSGSSMSAIGFVDESLGYCCDTNAGVYRIDGEDFERIGIENASGFTALAATEETVAVASDDGTIQRFDGTVWTPVRVSDGALNGLDTDGEEWLAVGAGGAIHENREGDWEPADSPTEAELSAVAAGDPPVAVGEGVLLERSG